MILEEFNDTDAPELARIHGPEGMNTLSGPPLEVSRALIQLWNSEKVVGRKMLVDGVLVAGATLTRQKFPHACELAFWVRKVEQRKGYGFCVVQRMLEIGFTTFELHRIFGKTFSNNHAAIRIMEKMGMIREGAHRDVGFKDGTFFDELYFGILDHEWKE